MLRFPLLGLSLIGSLLADRFGQATTQPAAGYRHAADTVRFHELTHGEIGMFTPAGARIMEQKHEATIGLVFGAADSVIAWYDTLSLEAQSIQGVRRPNTGPLLRQPYLLRMDNRGRVTTLRAPALPPDVREITDLSQAFVDFFVRLPGQPLASGLEWTDTLANETGRGEQSYRKYVVITKWRVEKDSVIGGAPVWVVASSGTVSLETGEPLPGQKGQAISALAGEEHSRAILSRDGRFLGRTREGKVAGHLAIRSGASSQRFEQDYTYQSRIEKVP
jgi:hypothetical protein